MPLAPLALTDAERSARKGNRGNNYLALEPDTRRFGSSENWLSFAASGRTLLSVGGLHGDEREALLRNWVTVGQEQGFRQFLLFPVHSSEREEVEASGFSTLVVGSEALLYLPDFKLDGSARRNLRQTIARASRVSGLAFREVSTAERGILLPVFSEWLASRLRPQMMGRLVGRPGFTQPLGRRYFAVFFGEKPVAFLTLTPGWNEQGWGMDTMARLPDAPPGVMEWLIVQSMKVVRKEGSIWFSLGASPMRLPERSIHSIPQPFRGVFRFLYTQPLGARLFPFRGLARFKEKFSPEWVPVRIGAYKNVSVWSLYEGCRIWGLFDEFPLDSARWPCPDSDGNFPGLEPHAPSVVQTGHPK